MNPNPRAKRPLPRCERCGLHLRLCLCGFANPLPTTTRVIVLMHRAERGKASNTGRLVPLALSRGEVRLRGVRGTPMATAGLVEPGRQSWLLYPADDSVELTPELADGPVTLVVPDGNWRQARKVARREPAVAALRRVHLPPGPPSRYRLRGHPDPKRVCTLEAIARALGVLEGRAAQEALERWLTVFVERTLWTRGELPASQVTGGIPPR